MAQRSKKSLRRAMRSYVGNEMYRERLVVGAVRVDLDGQPAGIVTRDTDTTILEN